MKRTLFETLGVMFVLSCSAQVQEVWVQRYNGGFTNVNHTPVAMVLDSAGNIYVAGSSQDAGSNYDYVVLKYAPDGSNAWATRWPAPGGGNATVNAFAVDAQGNSYATGTGGTVKWGGNGSPTWSVPYLGKDITVDADGSVYVTGLSVNEFATLKLASSGTNLWLRTWNTSDGEPAVSQKLGLDAEGNLYVAGWAGRAFNPPPEYLIAAWLLKYDAGGEMVWANECIDEFGAVGWADITGFQRDSLGNCYVSGNGYSPGETAKMNANGQGLWEYAEGVPKVSALVLDGAGGLYLAGEYYSTVKLDSASGDLMWIAPQLYVGNSVALDAAGNALVTGFTYPDPVTGSDWMTIKYDTNGNQLWAQTYSSPANGDNGAVVIAVALDGSVIVTGYSANTSGGTDITTIKYVQTPTITALASKAILVQVPGPPGQSLGLGATTDFSRWTELGPVVANTNGLFQFIDTNAALYPQRFYRWHGL